MGSLREQRDTVENAIDSIHDSIYQPGPDWPTHIPCLQSTLHELLAKYMNSIDMLESTMLSEGLGCWAMFEEAQQEGESLLLAVNDTIWL